MSYYIDISVEVADTSDNFDEEEAHERARELASQLKRNPDVIDSFVVDVTP